MASTNFVDDQTVIYAAWCNDVNSVVYSLLGNSGTVPATRADIRTNLGLGTAALQNVNSIAITGGTINGTAVGNTTPSTGSFTSITVSGLINQTSTSTLAQQVPGITRIVSGGGAAIREIGDVTSGTAGYIEIGHSFNASLNVGTGAWLNRDVANSNCWFDKWEGTTAKKQYWFSSNSGVLDVPTWTLKYEVDLLNSVMTVNMLSNLTSVAKSLTTVTANHVVTSNEHTIIVDATAAPITITLPSAALSLNRIVVVKRINSVANDVLVTSVAGSIDGAVSQLLNTQYMVQRYQSDGAVWHLI